MVGGNRRAVLSQTVIEIERHVAASGWDHAPRLYALVDTAELLAHEPQLADLGLTGDPATPGQLTPVEQEELPAGPLDEVLAGISWPAQVLGCALVQEIVLLPPGADAGLPRTLTRRPGPRGSRSIERPA